MERIISILRLVGILFIPIVIIVLSAIIWQNNNVFIDEILLLGGWWVLKELRLSSLLLWFLLLGAGLALSFILLLGSERKLHRELTQLRSQVKRPGKEQRKASSPGVKENRSQPNQVNEP